MILFWVTLFLLHQGHTLVPVTTVRLGQPATFTCALPKDFNSVIYWFHQSAGDTLKSIVRLQKQTSYVYGPEFHESKLEVTLNETIVSLTILRTVRQNEGMFHCAFDDWTGIIWGGTYLSMKGNTQRTSNYSAVQLPPPSDPVCPECTARSERIALVIAGVCLVISVIGNIVFICYFCLRAVRDKFRESTSSQVGNNSSQDTTAIHVTEGRDDLNYAALHFSGAKATRGRRKKELKTEDSVYSQVKYSV